MRASWLRPSLELPIEPRRWLPEAPRCRRSEAERSVPLGFPPGPWLTADGCGPREPSPPARRRPAKTPLPRPRACSTEARRSHATPSPPPWFPSKLTNVSQRRARGTVRLRQSQFCTYRMQRSQLPKIPGQCWRRQRLL